MIRKIVSEKIVFEGPLFSRTIGFENGKPTYSAINGKNIVGEWELSLSHSFISAPDFDWENVKTEYDDENKTFFFESNYSLRWEIKVYNNFISSRLSAKGNPIKNEKGNGRLPAEICDGFGHKNRHLSLRKVSFRDRTDICDSLVREEEISLYNCWGSTTPIEGFDGHLFILSDFISGSSLSVCKNSPSAFSHLNRKNADLFASCGEIYVSGTGINYSLLQPNEYTVGYPVSVMLCNIGEEEHLFRSAYEEECGGFKRFIMSNTWGDCSRDTAINGDFVKKEILCAEKIGVDVVQMDDGWQEGKSANSAYGGNVWSGGFYSERNDFWSLNKEKFPDGMEDLCSFARKHNTTVGLWYSADCQNNYENRNRDIENILRFYNEYGISHFKIDGIKIESKEAEKNLFSLLNEIKTQSNGNIGFNMDITDQIRPGFLLGKEFGTLFVENRYTDYANYYPSSTLRNLWQTARYIPAAKMQYEVLNPTRREDKYLSSDPLAPQNYHADWLFASVMVACPLIWMEMQNLNEDETSRLIKIVSCYRKYRDDFVEVIPWGEKPNGFSISGFRIVGKNNSYAVILRDNGEKNYADIEVKQILCTDDDNICYENGRITFSDKRKYAFVLL